MPRIYRLSKTGTKLLYKIRHHKGHGIHSPFVFRFINDVIEEKTPFYAYADIKTYVKKYFDSECSEDKINLLSFKIVNYFNPLQILELGSGSGVNTLYITSVSSGAECLSVELNPDNYLKSKLLYKHWDKNIIQSKDEFPVLKSKPDCVFINLKEYKVDHSTLVQYLLSIIKSETFIFLIGIRTNRKSNLLWNRLLNEKTVTISMDLFDVGILFFNQKYLKSNYKLSF